MEQEIQSADPGRRARCGSPAPSVLGHARVCRWCSPPAREIPSSWSYSTSPIGSVDLVGEESTWRFDDLRSRRPRFIARKLETTCGCSARVRTTSSAAVLREPRTISRSHDCLRFQLRISRAALGDFGCGSERRRADDASRSADG